MEKAVVDFIRENAEHAALDILSQIKKGQNVMNAMWYRDCFKSYIDIFLKSGNGIENSGYENSLQEMQRELKDIFNNLVLKFPYEAKDINRMCDIAERKIKQCCERKEEEKERKKVETRKEHLRSR